MSKGSSYRSRKSSPQRRHGAAYDIIGSYGGATNEAKGELPKPASGPPKVINSYVPLRVRTEYSFGAAFGQIRKITEAVASFDAAAIADPNSWGHVEFFSAMKAAGKQPILGATIATVAKLEKDQREDHNTFIARNDAGLKELYDMLTEATQSSEADEPGTSNFYFRPRLTWKRIGAVSKDLIILTDPNPTWEKVPQRKNVFAYIAPTSARNAATAAMEAGVRFIAGSDNIYPRPGDRGAYEIIASRSASGIVPRHIMTEDELRLAMPWLPDEAFSLTTMLARECGVSLPKAELVHYPSKKSLRDLCVEAAPKRKVNLKNKVYADRLDRELALIHEKKFEDYFFVIWDLIRYAKHHMMVGPARGSSCGSLVCYLLSITEIDPIPHGLLFERFIDITRQDLPDIDIDFADDRRDMVFDYLVKKYGAECVARLGTVNRFKAKSALGLAAKKLSIPHWEINDLKNSIIERSGGDSRAAFCVLDTFQQLDIGRATLRKYPSLAVAADIEDHANHTGQHAAGVVITARPTRQYCAIDNYKGVAEVDKYDAEKLNLLKIDALGLRTLSIIQDCLDACGLEREWLYRYPLDDQKAYDVVNKQHYAGIFQFEGLSLQSIAVQVNITKFNHIVALTALARPGPLGSGGTTKYLGRLLGQNKIEYAHPLTKSITEDTMGVVVYQEQVMQIVRQVGHLSWEDTSTLRKAMSKSLGKEYFDTFWERFKVGAAKEGMDEAVARSIWDQVNTMGSWAFNKSHAVAYGLVSYWCMVLKAYHPLEWAAACLRHARSDEQTVLLLRELVNEGFKYVAFDKDKSEINWVVKNGVLYGGLLGIKGIGAKMAEDIYHRRKARQPLKPKQQSLIDKPVLVYDDVFKCRTLWGKLKEDPSSYEVQMADGSWKPLRMVTPLVNAGDLRQDTPGTWAIIGRLMEKNLRDMNEPINLAKRGGERATHHELWLNMTFEDDTGSIIATIDRWKYPDLGKPIVEGGFIGEWFLMRARLRQGYRKLYIEHILHESRLRPRAAAFDEAAVEEAA